MPEQLNQLFRKVPFVAQHFTEDFHGHHEKLTPAESRLISQAVPKRVADFTTGRFCARMALSTIMDGKPEILQGTKREPLWPLGIVGSISHSSALAGAVAARENEVKAIGLDIETIGEVKTDLWDLLFSRSEKNFVLSEPEEAELRATLMFSLKESFYKMQYPFTGQFLEFTDIIISGKDGDFYFSQANPAPDLSKIIFPDIKMDWTVSGDQLITLCYLPG